MPGNAGGAKGPDFWCAFEDGEVVVIGDEPANTINDRRRRRLLCRGAKESYSPCRSRVRFVCSPCTSRRSQSESRMPEIGTSGSMSGDGKRSVAEWPKLPRPSSTLPKIKANASKHKAMSYERMKKREAELKAEVARMLAAAEAADAEEDETFGK